MKIKQFNQELDESFTSLWKGARDALKVRKLGKEAKKEGEKEVYDTYNISEINKLLAKLKNIAYGFYIAVTQPGANQNKIHIAIGKYEQFLNQVEFLYKKTIPSESYKSREFTGDDEAHGSEYRATTESLIREGAGLDYSLNNIKNSLLRYKNLLNIMKQVDVEEKTTVKKFINAYNNLGKIPEKPVAEPKPVEPSVEDFESSKTEEPEIKPRPGTTKNKIQIPVSKKGIIYKIYEIYHQLGPEKRKEFVINLKGMAKDFDPKLSSDKSMPDASLPKSSDGFEDDMPE